MAQGWAGSKPPVEKLLCGVCIQNGRNVAAITQIAGTLVCLEHASWIALPLHPNHE